MAEMKTEGHQEAIEKRYTGGSNFTPAVTWDTDINQPSVPSYSRVKFCHHCMILLFLLDFESFFDHFLVILL